MARRWSIGWMLASLSLVGASFVGVSTASAQHHGDHSSRLPSATLPPPPLMKGIGQSSMPITTDSESAQKFFDQGLNLLHCFWDFEAYRAFKEAIRQDSSAAMAHWGLFMALNYNQVELAGERQAALDAARRHSAEATERERRYIAAIGQLAAHSGRAAQDAYLREMETLVAAYPEDLQAKLLLIKFLVTDAGGTFSDPRTEEARDAFARARELLLPLLESHPNHAAVHHYWIHAHEGGPDPSAALESADRLPQLAPKSGHMLHMPGHIYFKVGLHDKAYAAFQESLAFDRAYMKDQGIDPVDNWNYVHNLDYLVANCAEDGRYREGQRYAQMLHDLPVELERSKSVGLGYIVYGGRTAPARFHMRYGRWDAAAASLEKGLASWQFPSQISADYVGALLAYARGMALFASGNAAQAGPHFQTLFSVTQKLEQQQAEQGADWYFQAARRVLEIGAAELVGLLMSSQGQHERALAELEKAANLEQALGYGEPPHYSRPVQESLGILYLRVGRWQDARQAFRKVLDERPNSGHAWFGIAKSHELAGEKAEARRAYQRLLEVWRHADRDLPQMQAAQQWLAANL
ncbi:MAG: tetratricopeptide repeat protein [Acidobacteriota bacterium]